MSHTLRGIGEEKRVKELLFELVFKIVFSFIITWGFYYMIAPFTGQFLAGCLAAITAQWFFNSPRKHKRN